MGRPKALLPFRGQPLIVHIVSLLQPLFAEIVVVAAAGQDLPSMPVTLVHDEVPGQGPAGGLYYGLSAATKLVGFVTSCDVVCLNGGLIAHLVARVEQYDAAVPCWQGRLQPLHAVYRRTVLPHLEAQLARGELKLVSVLKKVRTRRIDEDEIRRYDPDGSSFVNLNTPEDYADVARRMT